MELTQIHNIQVCVGEGYDEEFAKFIKEHSVSLEPGGNANEAGAEGARFALFLAEFCDPSWLKGLTNALPASSSPYCLVLGFLAGMPYYITVFRIDEIPHGSIRKSEIEAVIRPLLKKEFDSLLVVVAGFEIDVVRQVPHVWCWRLTPRKPVLSFDWEREQIQ